ncbi:type II toxin-antitoxin system PrlF family antitoxin [Pseudomonas sp. PCH199]|uniref:type II toxin-antitoxin system PrlF family antitoxin n=1 Tax=unclassified Pseudomonas TaxID=196821 RepID=UPI0015B042A3|nr:MULTISPECIES: type II toxin-antitoxin system PrlF family antitoxin [unclassified Pseudomonas]MCW8275208.1 type II toxin-antitoxin system PrlF family antitoxin [Pseudomonas sp. PCH199]
MNDSDPTSSIPTIHSGNESERTDASENDQVMFEFLSLQDDDIRNHPEKLIALDSTLLSRLDSLVGGIEVDINSPLSADDE